LNDKIPPAINDMSWTGKDPNGVPRNIYGLMSGEADSPFLKTLADPKKYPVATSAAEAYPMVLKLLALQVGEGGYVLNAQQQLQLPLKLPFIQFEFVTPEERGKVGVANVVTITVRVGGTDLKPGEAELAAFEDTGIVPRANHESYGFQKPPPSALRIH